MGKRKRGAIEVTAMGTASVSHHRKIQARTASMLRLRGWPSSLTKKKMRKQERGPDIMARLLAVRRDLRGLLEI